MCWIITRIIKKREFLSRYFKKYLHIAELFPFNSITSLHGCCTEMKLRKTMCRKKRKLIKYDFIDPCVQSLLAEKRKAFPFN